MNKEAITKARKDLNSIISNFAMNDFNKYNKKSNGEYYKKRRQYNLSSQTLEAKEILDLTYKNTITLDDERIIKAYLIPFRTLRTELLINTNIKNQ